jgi:hypothetical protein
MRDTTGSYLDERPGLSIQENSPYKRGSSTDYYPVMPPITEAILRGEEKNLMMTRVFNEIGSE